MIRTIASFLDLNIYAVLHSLATPEIVDVHGSTALIVTSRLGFYITRRDIPSRCHTNYFFGPMVIFGPLVFYLSSLV